MKLPHEKAAQLGVFFVSTPLQLLDFSNLPVAAPYIAMMPQWDFLKFLAEIGSAYPGFALRMRADAVDVVFEDGHVAGGVVNTREAAKTFTANLVVAADQRRGASR